MTLHHAAVFTTQPELSTCLGRRTWHQRPRATSSPGATRHLLYFRNYFAARKQQTPLTPRGEEIPHPQILAFPPQRVLGNRSEVRDGKTPPLDISEPRTWPDKASTGPNGVIRLKSPPQPSEYQTNTCSADCARGDDRTRPRLQASQSKLPESVARCLLGSVGFRS